MAKIKIKIPLELTNAVKEIFPNMDKTAFWCLNVIGRNFQKSDEHDGFRVENNGNMYFLTGKDKNDTK